MSVSSDARREAVTLAAAQISAAAEKISSEAMTWPEADAALASARQRIERTLQAEHGDDARRIVNEAVELVREAVQPKTPCRCGRRERFLNAVSSTAKCEGCGFPADLCRCSPLSEEKERSWQSIGETQDSSETCNTSGPSWLALTRGSRRH